MFALYLSLPMSADLFFNEMVLVGISGKYVNVDIQRDVAVVRFDDPEQKVKSI